MKDWRSFFPDFLGVLIFLVYSRDFQAVNSVQALENLSDGDLVYTVGFVEEQRVYSRDFSVLKLNNSIEVSCECEDWFEGETVEVKDL
jgi:hypothetical protein